MEDQNRLARALAADAWGRLVDLGAEQELFESCRVVDVDGTRDVTSIVFIVEPAVDDGV